MLFFSALLGASVLASQATAHPTKRTDASGRPVRLDRVRQAASVMNKDYLHSSGLWYQGSSELWWGSANILTTFGNLARYDAEFKDDFTTIAKNAHNEGLRYSKGTFLNKYYDDEGWWALAWIRAYDVTKNAAYLHTAESIYADLLKGLDAPCGGQWWSKDKNYLASISNELLAATAGGLAVRTTDKDKKASYTKVASDRVEWILNNKTGLITADGTIRDGVDPKTCKVIPKNSAVYTYNQGVILGALVNLYHLKNDKTYLDRGDTIVKGAFKTLTDSNGILKEHGSNAPNGNGALFKGVFVRNLMYLNQARTHPEYESFITKNAVSLWDHDRAANGTFGTVWAGPVEKVQAGGHNSGFDLLVAALAATYDGNC